MKVIYTCIENGDLKRLQNVQNFNRYIELEYTDYGWNMLHLAAWFKQDHILKYILEFPEASELINSKDKNQETPLHLAFFTSAKQCIQVLIEHGANPESQNIVQQVPVQTMIAPRENQIKTLLEIQKTLTNESQFNSISPYLQKLKQELDIERGSTTAPGDLQSKIKIEPISPIKNGNQNGDDDFQILSGNLNSQQPSGTKDVLILSFQTNPYNEELVGLSHFGSQQNLNSYNGQQFPLEKLLGQQNRNQEVVDEEIDINNEVKGNKTGVEETNDGNQSKNFKKKLTHKGYMEDSDIQDEQKTINLNYFQSRIRQFSTHSNHH